jgi:S-(hydroxymethyl)glutathione dehydrogenase/alcohol dehydrogenase
LKAGVSVSLTLRVAFLALSRISRFEFLMPIAPAAILYASQKPLVVEDIHVADPGAGEVLVRMKAAGVCHSDLHVMKGDLPMPCPIVLGHEGAGVVEAVGSGVTSVQPGDRVWPIWRSSCGRCEYCQCGRPALCELGTAMRFTGLMPDGKTRFHTLDGTPVRHYAGVSTFSSLSCMPESAVVRIESDISFEHAALISCGVITGLGAVTHAAQVRPGASVAVFGCGGVGLNIIQGARMVGAVRIIAVDTVASKESSARTLGATDFIDASKTDPVTAIKDLTGGLGVDFAFEAIGLPEPVEQAFDATRKGGVCVVAGICRADARARINVHNLLYAEKTIKGTLYGSMRPRVDLPRIVELHRCGALALEELLTRTWRLEEINEAYHSLERGEVARSLIVWE